MINLKISDKEGELLLKFLAEMEFEDTELICNRGQIEGAEKIESTFYNIYRQLKNQVGEVNRKWLELF